MARTMPPKPTQSQFVTGLFGLFATIVLVMTIPVWVSPARSLNAVFSDVSDVAQTQMEFVWVTNAVGMVFVAGLATFVAVWPNIMLVVLFCGFCLFFFGQACYELYYLEDTAASTIGQLIVNLVFFVLTLYAACLAPRKRPPPHTHTIVRVVFCIVFLFTLVINLGGIFAPSAAVNNYFTNADELSDTDKAHLAMLVFAGAVEGLLISGASLFNALAPRRALSALITIIIFVLLMISCHAFENRDSLNVKKESAAVVVAFEALLLLLSAFATFKTPADSGVNDYDKMNEPRV